MPPGGKRKNSGRKSTDRGKKVPCNTKIYPDQDMFLKNINKSQFICDAIDEKLERDAV